MAHEFDIHDHRHRVKQLRDDGDTAVFENRDELACPACSDPFERLLLIRSETISVPENSGEPFCLARCTETIALFRH
ncbi:flagella cluster protein [Natronorubrum sp. JWXQ-INN-674]|uniref:Flagella cluster protein n=2 Tax=Natronorubrum halalkaliphilum TaxID=2691917 RepID=A0A6B0VL61_9EURY|nr:flagella cluster protein [Natronorubrum halalkaliphilum]